MILGIIAGAWVFSRHGWFGVWWFAGACTVFSVVDWMFGLEVGRRGAELTIHLIERVLQ